MKSSFDSIRCSRFGKRIRRLRIGKYKAYYQRIALYVTGVNFFLLFYNFQLNNEWLPWYGWILVFVLVFSFLLFMDLVFIWEDELTTNASRNLILVENNVLMKRVDDQFEKVCDKLGIPYDKKKV